MLHGDILQLTQQALWFVLLLSAPPIIVMYIHEMGRMLGLPQGAAETAPTLCGPPRPMTR